MRKDKGGKGGRIIQICSLAGLMEFFFVPIYTGTKHAIRAYTASLASQPDIEAQGIEYGQLCPSNACTDLIMKLENSDIDYADQWIETVKKTAMPIQQVVDGFLELVQLKNMNCAMLLVEANARTYQRLQRLDVPNPDENTAERDDVNSEMSRWLAATQ